jgi:F-type H+-transporting ATPase subunit delta
MKSTKVAARYAKALLDLAIENNKVDQVLGDMNYIVGANAETHDFELLLKSPIIGPSNKNAIFSQLFDQFESVTKKFIELITVNGREGLLVEIANSFCNQVKEFKGIVPVTITTASAMSAETRDKILSKVKGLIHGTIEVTEEVNPALIGGFIVKMDDKRIDASVANQLNNLKQHLIS